MQGLWSGMIGGTLMQTVILVWVTLRTDWNKEVNVGFNYEFLSNFYYP